MKKQINITVDLTSECIWEQIEEIYIILHELDQKKPWYKRIISWF